MVAFGTAVRDVDISLAQTNVSGKQRLLETGEEIQSQLLRAKGVGVLRFWEHEIQNNLAACVRKIINCRARLVIP